MRLNTLSPASGQKKKAKRAGRGIGSGLGKTCGKGHKGQKSRSGGYNKLGFEGGQMPVQRRLPKFGFNSRKALYRKEIRLDQINRLNDDIIDIPSLRKAKLVSVKNEYIKIIGSGKIEKAIIVRGINITKGAKSAIESAGGRIEEF